MARIRFAILVVALLCAGPADGIPREKEKWIEVRTANFVLYSDAKERHVKEIGLDLERLRRSLILLFEKMEVRSPVPIHIFVFKNEKSLKRYVVSKDPDHPTAGIYMQSTEGNYVGINGDAGWSPMRIMYHEYFHYFVHNNLDFNLPVWFDEGLAEYYEAFQVDKNKVKIGLPVEGHIYFLRTHPLIPLYQLFRINHSSSAYNEGERRGVFYAQSWALMHMILSNEELRSRLDEFVRYLEEEKTVVKAISRAFAMDEVELMARLEEYVGRNSFSFTTYTFDQIEIDETVQARRMEYTEVLHRLGDFLAHKNGEESEAREHYETLRALVPEHAGAEAGLGFVCLQEEMYEEAAEFFRRSIAIEGSDYRTHYLLGKSLLDNFREKSAGSARLDSVPPDVLEARESFQRCMDLNPGFPYAYSGFGLSYMYGETETVPGIQALLYAHDLMPHEKSVAYNLLVLLLERGDREGAEELQATYFIPLNDPEYNRIVKEAILLDDIDRAEHLLEKDRREEALALIDHVARETSDHLRKERLTRWSNSLRSNMEARQNVDRYNRAIELANSGDREGAVKLLGRVIKDADDPNLVESARKVRNDIRRSMRGR